MNAKSKATVISLPIGAMLSEYDSLREQKKKIEDRMKYLADQIKANAEKVGVKDDKGSFYAEDEQFIYGKQCKKSVSFNQEKALSYFRDHGYDDCITTVEVINEEAVESRINTGDISFEDLEDITTTKVSYAIDLKRKEEMSEVEQTEVPIAASKKSRLVPKGRKEVMPAVKKDFVLPNGQKIELFYIGTLASALGRSTNAIRKWEIAGVIPDPCFKDERGRRLYSQEQIDAIVRCAEKAKIKQGLSIANTSFSTWVHKELAVLRDKYANGGK